MPILQRKISASRFGNNGTKRDYGTDGKLEDFRLFGYFSLFRNLSSSIFSLEFSPVVTAWNLEVNSFIPSLHFLFVQDMALQPDIGSQKAAAFEFPFQPIPIYQHFKCDSFEIDIDTDQITGSLGIFDDTPGKDGAAQCIIILRELLPRRAG